MMDFVANWDTDDLVVIWSWWCATAAGAVHLYMYSCTPELERSNDNTECFDVMSTVH